MNYPPRTQILGVPVDPFSMEQTIHRANDLLDEGIFAHLIGVNADKVLQAKDDASVKAALERCELVNADGASMLLAARWLNVPIPERVAGIDLMDELCTLAARRGSAVYLLGAKPNVVADARLNLQKKHPALNVVGIRDGYFGEEEYVAVGAAITKLNPAIVFVGITSPKKEILIESFRDQGLTGLFVGVGGSFDVVSGHIPRAPGWVQRLHCEWLFRMLQEPRRLFKRYLVGNTRFLILLGREKLKFGKGRTA